MSPDLERLIGRAVVDKKFRKALLDDVDAAVRDSGFSLTADELAKVHDGAKERKKDHKKTDDVMEAARGSQWA